MIAQTFTAPDGTLDSLQLMFQARVPGISNVGDSIFHLVILEFVCVGSSGRRVGRRASRLPTGYVRRRMVDG